MFHVIVRAVLGSLLAVSIVPAASGQEDRRPHVVMLIAEREYETEKSLPTFADAHLGDRYRTTIVEAAPGDRNRLEGIGAVGSADVLLVSVRRRTLPREQLQIIRDYVSHGKPVVGIRTANHAFAVRGGDVGQGRAVWPEWDREVFGGNYTNHYGNSLEAVIRVVDTPARKSALLEGLREVEPFVAGGSLYRVSPLADGTTVLMTGKVEGHPAEPVAWAYVRDGGGRSFYTSLGHVDDFAGDVLPRLLVNAIEWSLEGSAAAKR